jgi:hypothetical protein
MFDCKVHPPLMIERAERHPYCPSSPHCSSPGIGFRSNRTHTPSGMNLASNLGYQSFQIGSPTGTGLNRGLRFISLPIQS